MAELNELINDGKNKHDIKCKNCGSLILTSMSSTFIKQSKNLPTVSQKKDINVAVEEVSEWWLAKDMYTFENIGFTHTVDLIKYLSCADCEIGPVGYHDTQTKESFVALCRVKHE